MTIVRPSVSRVKEAISSCIEPFTNDKCVPSMSGKISEIVKEKVKELVVERYKVIVEAFVYEDRGQSIHIVSKCLWDKDRDTMVQWEKVCDDGTTIVVVVYCIYFE